MRRTDCNGWASSAGAATLIGSAEGLAAPGVTIGFEDVTLSGGTNVTTELAGLGAEFTPGVYYDNLISACPNFAGPAVVSFFGADFSILFTQNVTEIATAMTANFGGATLTALLDSVIVESFFTPLDLLANNFYGFTGILFDEVAITPAGSTSIALDNLSFTVEVVPVTTSLPLLLGALGGIALARRRRNAG